MTPKDKKSLAKLQDGSLRDEMNQAIADYGHGTLHLDDGTTVPIGGSTGGRLREILDNHLEPEPQRLL